MTNKILTFFLILIAFGVQAQEESTRDFEPIDYQSLEKEFAQQSFEEDYIKLLQRYQNGDSTLSLEQKRLVYFGSTFQDFYNPYYSSDLEDELNELAKKSTINKKEEERIQEIALEILSENPFEINSLYTLGNFYEKSGKEEQSNIYLNRILTIFDAIFSTGTGLTSKEPLYVTQISHEYEVLAILNLPYAGQQSVIDNCDFLAVTNDEIDGLYFEITAPFLFLTEQFSN